MSLAYDLFVNGSPIAIGVLVIYAKQTKMARALVRIADETEGVDAGRVEEDLKLL